MSIISKRLVSIAASTLVLSLVSASAHAQIDVFSSLTNANYGFGGTLVSTYTFNSSMILNSIAFATNGGSNVALSYQVNGGGYTSVSIASLGTTDSKGFQWFDLGSGLTMQSGTTLDVKMVGSSASAAEHNYAYTQGANVTYSGFSPHGSHLTNSNLRVSNPGSNVAPEPASFALALTGGAALLGICVRRRRNAG